jgi:C-8 sterol isomerase
MLKIFHASLTEYVILFGTALGTSGFSGRYRMECWDAMISGEMKTSLEDAPFDLQVYRPGDLAHLPKGKVKAWGVSEESWMLEYGRGLIPTALPVGVGDAIFSAMDPVTLFKTLGGYGKITVKELLKGKI